MKIIQQCKCGIAAIDCEYHKTPEIKELKTYFNDEGVFGFDNSKGIFVPITSPPAGIIVYPDGKCIENPTEEEWNAHMDYLNLHNPRFHVNQDCWGEHLAQSQAFQDELDKLTKEIKVECGCATFTVCAKHAAQDCWGEYLCEAERMQAIQDEFNTVLKQIQQAHQLINGKDK